MMNHRWVVDADGERVVLDGGKPTYGVLTCEDIKTLYRELITRHPTGEPCPKCGSTRFHAVTVQCSGCGALSEN